MTFDEKVSAATGTAATEARDDRGHRLLWVFVVVLVIGALTTGTVYLVDRASSRDQLAQQGQQITALVQHADQAAKDAAKLAEQVRGLGGVPVVQPAPAPSAGPAGATGAPGQPGRDGASPACLSEPSQCRGADGQDGDKGQSGTDGQNGKDGTDGQSPPCLSEPAQCRGADGRPGTDGNPPAGWTTTYPDGSTQTCSRADPFDPTAPRYTCTSNAAPQLLIGRNGR